MEMWTWSQALQRGLKALWAHQVYVCVSGMYSCVRSALSVCMRALCMCACVRACVRVYVCVRVCACVQLLSITACQLNCAAGDILNLLWISLAAHMLLPLPYGFENLHVFHFPAM